MLLYICLVILLFILIIPLLNIVIETKVFIKKDTSYALIIIRLFKGLVKLSFNLAVSPNKKRMFAVKLKEKVPILKDQSSLKDLYNLFKRSAEGYGVYKGVIVDFISKVKFEKFLIKIIIGLDDASYTAMTTGGLYTLLHLSVLYLVNRFSLKEYEIKVMPHYHGLLFELNLDCIIKIKIGDIIIAGFKFIFRKLKGGDNVVGASNRKCYEDYYGKS